MELHCPTASIVLPTYNRAEILHETLRSLCAQVIDADWEIIVIDNGSTDHTPAVLAEMQADLPLTVLAERRRGKSRAVNLALRKVRGSLIVFTDDDVRPGQKWLAEYVRAALEYPDSSVFCGPISPIFPNNAPAWLRTHLYSVEAFGNFCPPLEEGYLPPPLLPFGSNFAVRASALRGMTMREDLGPSEESDLMSEDTEFVKRLRQRAPAFVFLPGAKIGHFLRPEQVELPWLFERAFRLGRSLIVESNLLDIENGTAVAHEGEVGEFEQGMRLNYHYGQMYQLLLAGSRLRSHAVRDTVAADWSGDAELLSPTARRWLAENCDLVPPAARKRFSESLSRDSSQAVA